jgi:hypothetical protein
MQLYTVGLGYPQFCFVRLFLLSRGYLFLARLDQLIIYCVKTAFQSRLFYIKPIFEDKGTAFYILRQYLIFDIWTCLHVIYIIYATV